MRLMESLSKDYTRLVLAKTVCISDCQKTIYATAPLKTVDFSRN